MARRKKGKDINGILLLDKPFGSSSNAALQKVRYLFDAKKAGHTGSLDPLATGVLPICFGEASKVTAYLLESDKRYTCTAQLGVTTTTGDKEGEILQTRDITPFDQATIENILETFRGEIKQIPPMYSALKHNGQPLYKLARQGIDIKRKARDVTIHELKLIKFDKETLTLDIHCSKGTYIRTLAQDIGEALSCGAHLSMLRRTHVSPFNCEKLYSIEEIETLSKQNGLLDILLPIDSALPNLPHITLNNAQANQIKNGLKVNIEKDELAKAPLIRLYLENGEFIGIGRYSSSDKTLAPKRLMRTN